MNETCETCIDCKQIYSPDIGDYYLPQPRCTPCKEKQKQKFTPRKYKVAGEAKDQAKKSLDQFLRTMK